MIMMISKIKGMLMKGVGMLATKKGMLAAIIFGAPLVGIAVSPEYAASLAEHMSILLQMLLDVLEPSTTAAAVEVVE